MASNENYSSDTNEEFFNKQERRNIDLDMARGSDDIKEMFCEECEKHENIITPAEGFCVDCVEYKCKTCLKFHGRHFGTHHIQNEVNMPQDFCFDKCTKHAKELIKFYCIKCENFACCECRKCEHQNCSNVKHLPSLVKDIEESEELNAFKENLKKISKDIDMIKDNLQLKTKLSHTLESKAKTTIEEHKDKLNSTYDQYQKETLEKFDQNMEETIAKLRKEREELVYHLEEKHTNFNKNLMHSEQAVMKSVEEQKQFLESLEARHRTLTNDVADISNKIIQAQSSGQKCNLFVTMKIKKETLAKVEKDINDLKMQDIPYFAIEPVNPDVSETSAELTNAFFSFKEYHSATRRIATFNKNLSTKSTKESYLCMLSPNKLIEIDTTGQCINTIENILNQNAGPYNEIKMPSSPCGVAKVEENKAAVTFASEGIVRLITFSESMTVVKTDDLTVGAGCRGIVYCNDNLIVSYMKLGKVQIFDMAGNVQKCFEKDLNGQFLFSRPDNLALSPDNKTLYISDWSRHTVTSMTLDGQIKAIYKDNELRQPRQLAVDETGTVYVCGKLSSNVHQLSAELIKVKILLDRRKEINQPVSIAYCQKNSRLYVGMWDSNIQEFHLTLEKSKKK